MRVNDCGQLVTRLKVVHVFSEELGVIFPFFSPLQFLLVIFVSIFIFVVVVIVLTVEIFLFLFVVKVVLVK